MAQHKMNPSPHTLSCTTARNSYWPDFTPVKSENDTI